jgi:tRNA-splicing ligase RtcB
LIGFNLQESTFKNSVKKKREIMGKKSKDKPKKQRQHVVIKGPRIDAVSGPSDDGEALGALLFGDAPTQRQARYAVERVDHSRWRIPKQGAMLTEGLIFSSDALIQDLRHDPCVDQVANVASLPGIVGASMAMPDMHWGYGFPIGGVAAFDMQDGIICPGGIGFDINCGVRLLRTGLTIEDVRAAPERFDRLMTTLYLSIPSGVGTGRDDVRLQRADMDALVERGAGWVVEQGWGEAQDLDFIEARGALPGADFKAVSGRAFDRGKVQLGTLGSGNHFCELGYIDALYDDPSAQAFGLRSGQITVMIHTGSRGFGYQVCEENLKRMLKLNQDQGFDLPDKQLCFAPLASPHGQAYLAAMNAAANFAFGNRQLITDRVRDALRKTFGDGAGPVEIIYDVCHNIAKVEQHMVEGRLREVCVHRKGATRAFPPGHPETPAAYAQVGQPVLVPGDMGRYSYILAGTQGAWLETFGSCCHGAGRRLSRTSARRKAQGRHLIQELAAQGVSVRAASRRTVDEEMPEAYKDVAEVVEVVEAAGIGRKVARIRPIGVVKG